VADLSLLKNLFISKVENPKKVHLPNGDKALVTHLGSSTLDGKNTVSGVFYIPQFKFNLLSVAKLTKELNCSASFFPDFYLFQELFSGKVKMIGKEDGGLYVLSNKIDKEDDVVLSARHSEHSDRKAEKIDIQLLHKRLGHSSSSKLKKLLNTSLEDITKSISKCIYVLVPNKLECHFLLVLLEA